MDVQFSLSVRRFVFPEDCFLVFGGWVFRPGREPPPPPPVAQQSHVPVLAVSEGNYHRSYHQPRAPQAPTDCHNRLGHSPSPTLPYVKCQGVQHRQRQISEGWGARQHHGHADRGLGTGLLLKGRPKVCVPKIGLKFPAPLINFNLSN